MKRTEVLDFTYKKDTGDLSNRKVFVISAPSDMLFGIDLTELEDDAVDLEKTSAMLAEIYNRHDKEIQAEIAALDLSSNYRRFKKEGII